MFPLSQFTISLTISPQSVGEAQAAAEDLVQIAALLRLLFPLPITGVDVVHEPAAPPVPLH